MSRRDVRKDLDLIDPKVLFLDRDDTSDTARLPLLEEDADEGSAVPRITSLPEGIEVIEQQVGRAVGTWILQVRCQCGRRWFELSPVEATHCPRCGTYVYIDVAVGKGPQT
jgi:hypothetical protein